MATKQQLELILPLIWLAMSHDDDEHMLNSISKEDISKYWMIRRGRFFFVRTFLVVDVKLPVAEDCDTAIWRDFRLLFARIFAEQTSAVLHSARMDFLRQHLPWAIVTVRSLADSALSLCHLRHVQPKSL